MSTWKMAIGGRVARWAAVGIGSMLTAVALASPASADHGVLEQVSTGPAGGGYNIFEATFVGAAADGSRIWFSTQESLVSVDTDMWTDVYERSGGQTTLVSTGPDGGNGAANASFAGASADGSRVWFSTRESLVSADTDTFADVYERSGGQTTLVSTGPDGGNNSFEASFVGASVDGSRVFFETSESLVSADANPYIDVYERSGGQTTLVSTSSLWPANFVGASDDGGRVFYRTQGRQAPADTDFQYDLYERSGGQTTLVSTGPNGGNGAFPALTAAVSGDGGRVLFPTVEQLVSTDTDAMEDVYERAGGQTTLVSTGPQGGNGAVAAFFERASDDGGRVWFRTVESLVSADTDSVVDVYERAGGQTTLVSTGPQGGNGANSSFFKGASANGTRVFFETAEQLVSGDTDTFLDVYERSGGQTTLVSTGPAGGNGTFDSLFAGTSADGSRVFFQTGERLVSTDTDDSLDVYERAGGQTTLISTGNGPFGALFQGASADGSSVYFATAEPLGSDDYDSAADVYVKRAAPVNTARPAISGTPLVGQRLSCSPGTWDHNPTNLIYQWKRAGVAITGATSSGYTLVGADGARSVTCTVTASNGAGSHSATSAPVTPRFPGACANVQTGSAGPDRLTGLALGDRLRGLGGNDVLIGLGGDDCLAGGAGNDTLAAGAGNDTLAGEAGDDTLRGDSGTDRFAGGAGNDTINSLDGRRETVDCGLGSRDRVTADRLDRLVGCETVRRG